MERGICEESGGGWQCCKWWGLKQGLRIRESECSMWGVEAVTISMGEWWRVEWLALFSRGAVQSLGQCDEMSVVRLHAGAR